MDIKKVLNLTIEVMKSKGIKWDSLSEDEQLRILSKLPEINSALIASIEDTLGIGDENETGTKSETGIVETENGDVTITTF